jgi:hypothetical protein
MAMANLPRALVDRAADRELADMAARDASALQPYGVGNGLTDPKMWLTDVLAFVFGSGGILIPFESLPLTTL